MTTQDTNGVQITAAFDRKLAFHRGDSVRYLVVTTKAPDIQREEDAPRKPLNLALVIDASGSMRGAPIEAARRAASGVVELLRDGDVISLVSFDTNVTTHISGCVISTESRQKAQDLIAGVNARSSTNLSGGWLEGAECVARKLEGESGAIGRVLVMSDGYANQGICDHAELGRIAAGLRDRGVFTSTVGIGAGYSPEQIQTIAEQGGGLMHHAERPEEIVEVVMGELGETMQQYAVDTELHISRDARVRMDVLGDFPTFSSSERYVCKLGSLICGNSRTVVFKVVLPKGEPGEALQFGLTLKMRLPEVSEQQVVDAGTVELHLAESRENSRQERDLALSLIVAERWQADVAGRALALNRAGRYEESAELVFNELHYFEGYCRDVPGAERFPHEMRVFAERFARPMDAMFSREVEHDRYRLIKGKRDHRLRQRPDWKSRMLDENGMPQGR